PSKAVVGQQVLGGSGTGAIDDPAKVASYRYVPIYTDNNGGRVVGFGHVLIAAGASPTLTKKEEIVAPENVSATLTLPLDSTIDVTTLMSDRRSLETHQPLRAPALVR